MPCDSTTLSSLAAASSQPSSYDIPEHPPPTTRIRSPHSGLPSSSRRSVIFFAAVSVNVIIRASLGGFGPDDELLVPQYNRGRTGGDGRLTPAGRRGRARPPPATAASPRAGDWGPARPLRRRAPRDWG